MRSTHRQTVKLPSIAALLLAVPFVMGPTPCNLYIPEYPGSSEKEGREDSSDIFEIEHHLTQPIDGETGAATGRRRHRLLTVTKVIDKATPGLHKALTTGEILSDVTLEFYRISPLGSEEVYYTITLRGARIAKMRTYMPNTLLRQFESMGHMEQVSMVYEEIEWNWIPDGSVEVDQWAPDVVPTQRENGSLEPDEESDEVDDDRKERRSDHGVRERGARETDRDDR